MASPCAELHAAGHFALRPSLLGGLLPFNINMWLGNTPPSGGGAGGRGGGAGQEGQEGGSSSGLHHDFHDNLYVLLRGRKRFQLYSPSSARAMALAGELSRVHANGVSTVVVSLL